MTRKYEKAIREQKNQTLRTQLEIYGTLGIPIGGERLVEVPNRPSFVYVKLRDNQNEVVQAFNNKVAQSYGLPVILQREGNRYIILGVNTQRYQNNWNNYSPYLPKHGPAHSFSENGGGDTVWVFSRQFMPLLVYPSTSTTGTNVQIGGQGLLHNGVWKYVGNTGTIDLLQYRPTGGDSSIMALVYLDVNTGNPGILVGSGSAFSNALTGSVGGIYPYLPIPAAHQIPLSGIRLSTGTNRIGWRDLYDVRQWLHPTISGSSSGGGGGASDGFGVVGLDEGVLLGTGAYLNVVGAGATLSISGSMLRLDVPGGGFSGVPIYNQGTPIVTGTAIDFTGNVYVSASGTRATVNFPITTYFRVGQPDYLSNPTGLYWRVPDRVYASGSLGVFVGGHALIPGIDYVEHLYVSGTYQYLTAQPTGSYHLTHYGVPCYPQIQAAVEDMTFWLTDSDGEFLLDSDDVQLTDSDG